MPKIVVGIEWDEPNEPFWLNPDNVAVALHAFSTRYDVDEVHVSVAFTWDMPKAERIARVYESYRHRIRGAKRTQVFGCMHMVGLARCWPEWAILGCRLRPD